MVNHLEVRELIDRRAAAIDKSNSVNRFITTSGEHETPVIGALSRANFALDGEGQKARKRMSVEETACLFRSEHFAIPRR
jgi:hypothetical protein